MLEEPDAESVDSDVVGADDFDDDVYPSTALKSTNNSACGLSWSESTDPNVNRYG